eukprot:TRINITY_DN59310_c0_g1_i1.p1 TRINITY_DN59310_c0_g1~~TRINITY_DN59310_c0_g1_i1.p1  ORF type:complete len:494 (+),score=80.06 TRINITY_DN59310_c0_g1_i1:44-1483(+)
MVTVLASARLASRRYRLSGFVLLLGLLATAACLCRSHICFVSGVLNRDRLAAVSSHVRSALFERRRLVLAARGGFEGDSFTVGDYVEAICPDDEEWYPGTIDKVNSDGSFSVKWDDPEEGPLAHDIESDAIKKIFIYKDFKAGEIIQAVFPDDGKYYPGEVAGINDDGTFVVKWADPGEGPQTSKLQPFDIKYPPIPFDKLQVGQKYTGTVRSVLDHGAFVDIGAETDGLLHVSAISKDRIQSIHDHLSEYQEVDVWITGKTDDGTYGLTMLEGLTSAATAAASVSPAPSELTPFLGISADEWQNGVVVRTASFGAFVTVTLDSGAEATGLVHISKLRDGFVDNVDDEVSVGQEVQVRILSVDVDANKMSLSMRQGSGGGGERASGARKPSDLSSFQQISPDTWLTGKVARCTRFGAFVTVSTEDGTSADGLVHITQIRDGFVESVEEELSVGQEVQVRVESVDIGLGKMSLSMKQPEY